ncbi:MAG: 3-dehydroquinate synthase [Phycisphaerales bacterium JB040]
MRAGDQPHQPAANDHPFAVPFTHRFRTLPDALDPGNPSLAGLLEPTGESGAARVGVFLDAGLVEARPDLPERVRAYFDAHADRLTLTSDPTHVTGGEDCKNDESILHAVLQRMHDDRLCRRSYALTIGGGAVLDCVGYAASITHRGIRQVRLPSTTLAQGDSGVGVKNGVNAFGKKNFLGVFAPPHAVVNDPALLATLSDRDWRSGFSEAVKVALLKDAPLFEQIERHAARINARAPEALDTAHAILERSARLHLDHIVRGGDPFETANARPLDFGHWAAHKLESLTNYDLRHGEAVAIGIALDTRYSAHIGLCPPELADRVHSSLTALGFTLAHPLLARPEAVLPGLDEFREHLGGELTITLCPEPGRDAEVHSIDENAMRRAFAVLASAPEHAS